jgi:PASTA domain
VADDQPNPEDQPADTAHQPQDPWHGRETSEFPPTGDETAALPPPGRGDTAPLPAAGGPGEEPPRWTARAGVPARPPRGAVPQEQEWVPEQEPRSWWLPLLITLAVLILLGLIGLGVWLALHAQPGPTPGASPSTSASPSAVASSASPTPSPSPASSAPLVEVPDLHGQTVSDAQATLQGLGLTVQVQTQVTDAQPAGTVISTRPTVGSKVPAGSQVTLIVAAPPPTSASPSPSPSASSPSPTP